MSRKAPPDPSHPSLPEERSPPIRHASSSASHATLSPGVLLGGRFRIVALRAAGGGGAVYLAHDEQLGSAAAVKVARADWADLHLLRPAFDREADLSLRLGERLGATGRARGEHQGLPFLALDFIDGPTLRERLSGGQPLPVAEVRRMADRLLRRLGALHDEGLAHLDLKPAHVMAGGATLLDLGSALPVGEARDRVGASVAYAAPEQWTEAAIADRRSDVYAMGVVLYEALLGRRPFAVDPSAPMSHLAHRQPADVAPLEGAGAGLAAVVGRALAPDPAARFADAGALRAALALGSEAPEPA